MTLPEARHATITGTPRGRTQSAELLCLVLLFGAGAVAALDLPLNADVAWLLHVAERFVAGDRLYTDVIEVNPPLIVLLMTPAAAAAKWLGMWAVTAFRVETLGLAALSIWLSRRQLRRGGAGFMESALLSLVLAAIFLFLPGAEFGQREHLMLMLVVPYLLGAGTRLNGGKVPAGEAVLVGALGALGFLLKPHFLLVWVAAESILAVRQRRLAWRPELSGAAAVAGLYAVALLTFAAAYLHVARWAAPLYGAYFPSSPVQIARSRGAVFALVTILAALGIHYRRAASAVTLLFTTATAMFAVVVFLQNKGWDYHWLPVYGTGAVVWSTLPWDLAARRQHGRGRSLLSFRVPAPATYALVTLALLGAGLWHGRTAALRSRAVYEGIYQLSSLGALLEREPTDRGIFLFASSPLPAFPLVTYSGVEWASGYNCLWPVLGFYPPTPAGTRVFRYHQPAEMHPVEREFFNRIVSDLVRARPSLLIIDRAPPGRVLNGFDYLTYFSADPHFRALLREYAAPYRVGRYSILRHQSASPTS